jgi:hypothetical protein
MAWCLISKTQKQRNNEIQRNNLVELLSAAHDSPALQKPVMKCTGKEGHIGDGTNSL